MIQRIQTIFLFLISVTLIAFLFMPIWKANDTGDKRGQTVVKLDAFNIDEEPIATVAEGKGEPEKSVFYIAAIAILAALNAFYSIFKYTNRLLQLKLGLFNSLLLCALLGTFFLGIKEATKFVDKAGPITFAIGFYIPLAALVLNMLANRYIRKDEALVRSVDRLR